VPNRVTDDDILQIPGWFSSADIALFRLFLDEQQRAGMQGDLAEIGVYLGSSAVLIGDFLRPEEQFTVVDVFEESGTDQANRNENAQWYDGLSQRRFEQNYQRLHTELPVVVRGLSTTIRQHARHGTHRFVHVDASHLYAHVREDVETARLLLAPDGIVVFDDYRSEHAPGVAAAVWPALGDGLVPLVVSHGKLYATWGDPAPWLAAVERWLPRSDFTSETHEIAGHRVVRVWRPVSGGAVDWVPPRLVPLALSVRSRLRRLQAGRA
jgi:predicted O-methyltransferase YrrM